MQKLWQKRLRRGGVARGSPKKSPARANRTLVWVPGNHHNVAARCMALCAHTDAALPPPRCRRGGGAAAPAAAVPTSWPLFGLRARWRRGAQCATGRAASAATTRCACACCSEAAAAGQAPGSASTEEAPVLFDFIEHANRPPAHLHSGSGAAAKGHPCFGLPYKPPEGRGRAAEGQRRVHVHCACSLLDERPGHPVLTIRQLVLQRYRESRGGEAAVEGIANKGSVGAREGEDACRLLGIQAAQRVHGPWLHGCPDI